MTNEDQGGQWHIHAAIHWLGWELFFDWRSKKK